MLATIDSTRLKVFREVADHGSFTDAATALHISQPAVSQHVAKLEQELGLALLERSSRRVRLTPAGEVFLRHIDSLLTGLDDARRELAAVARSDSGRLRLAVFPSAAATFLPVVVAQFRAAFPKMGVSLSEVDPPLALPKVVTGDVDLALVYDYPLVGSACDPRLEWETVGVDTMAVAVRADSALAASPQATLAEIADQPWVAPGPSMCREALDEACRRAGVAPWIVSETNDYQAMLGMVAAGVGVAVVPRLVGLMATPGTVVLRPLAATRLQRVVALAHRRQAVLTPAMEMVSALLTKTVAELVAQPSLPSV